MEDTQTCLNFLMRRATRILSRGFDEALRPHSLRATQFNALAVLAQSGPTSLTVLADLMVLERSALARNLKPLEREGLVTVTVGKDRRTRVAFLTAKGRRKLLRALPAWAEAQALVLGQLGRENAELLTKLAQSIEAGLLTQTRHED